jgi:hypothetical protein
MSTEEFGTVVQLPEMTLGSLEATVNQLREDFRHQQKHSFPLYFEDPKLIFHQIGGPSTVNMHGEPMPTEVAYVVGWHLEVPEKHVVS